MLTREEFAARHDALTAEIGVVRDRVNREEGAASGVNIFRRNQVAVAALFVSIATVLVAALVIFK